MQDKISSEFDPEIDSPVSENLVVPINSICTHPAVVYLAINFPTAPDVAPVIVSPIVNLFDMSSAAANIPAYPIYCSSKKVLKAEDFLGQSVQVF